MSGIINPYIAGAPVTEAKMFFGREDVFEWIERSLSGQYVDHILVIHGQRRVGKTSILKQLRHHLPDQYIPVFFDLQGRTRTTLDRFLWWLAREIVRTLQEDRQIGLSRPEREAFATDPDYLENHFLPGLQPYLDGRHLLLTFDEFDSLQQEEIRENIARPLIDSLQRLTGREGLNFIFSIGSSGQKLENMRASYTEFFKAALYKQVTFLKRDDTFRLITKPVEGVLQYDPLAVSRIYDITSGHPYFTQLTCHELFSHCQQSGAQRVGEQDVELVLEDVVERGTVNLKFVWDEAAELEKWALAGLAQFDDSRVETPQLAQLLEKQRVRFSRSELEGALLHLQEKDVLTRDNRFVVYLMHLWLLRNRPLERVREELVDLNPIASRYFEIGLEYRDAGEYQKAAENFEAALAVDPENLEAQIGLGDVYLAQQQYPEAAAAYDQALKLDEDDIAARSGQERAYLAWGDRMLAQGDPDEAADLYRQVLANNLEAGSARQKLAAISLRQGEQALEGGDLKVALLAHYTALQYTPEDQVLENQYQALLAEHGPGVVLALRKAAERDAAAERWDEAVTSLEEALCLAPDDEALEEALGQARDKHLEARQAKFKEKAQLATKEERWDEAAAAWRTYLELGPADRQEAETALELAHQKQALEALYGQAQEALTAKESDRAIAKLKEIVQIDPNYKDTTRLLATAVESSRQRRSRRTRWLRYGVPVVLILLLTGTYLGLRLTDNLPAISLSEAEPTPTPIQPKPTITPTPRPTPIANSAWVTDFAEPLLAAVADQAPLFEDDFSEDMGFWRVGDDVRRYVTWEDGALKLSGENNGGGGAGLLLDTAEFIAQFELEPLGIGAESYFGLNLSDPATNEWTNIGFDLSKGFAGIDQGFGNNDDPWRIVDQATWWRNTARELTLIGADNKLAVYLDGEPLNAVSKIFPDGQASRVWLNLGVGENGGQMALAVDNFRLWELEGVTPDPIAPMREAPRPTPTSEPVWATDFVDPILAEIAGQPAQVVDDFSSRMNFWDVHSGAVQWFGEALHLSGGANQDANVGFRNNSENGFVTQFRFKIDSGEEDSAFTVFILNDQGDEVYFSFGRNGFLDLDDRRTSQAGSDDWYQENTTWWELPGPGPFEDHELTIIGRDDRLALTIDGKPLNALSYFPSGSGPIALGIPPGGSMVAQVDDLRYWDLDLLDKGPLGEEILAMIADVPPTFEEDFSDPDPSWWEIQPGLPLRTLVQDGTLVASLSDETTLEHSLFVRGPFHGKDFVLEFDLRPVDFRAGMSEIWLNFRSNPDPENEESYIFRFYDSGGRWALDKASQGIKNTLQEGITSEMREGEMTRVRLVAFGDQFFLYLNDVLTAYFQDGDLQGTDNEIQVESDTGEFRAGIDNLKFWLLEAPSCLMMQTTWLKREPNSEAPVNPAGNVETGTPATIIETASGEDGTTWYYIETQDQTGSVVSGYVLEQALSEACFR